MADRPAFAVGVTLLITAFAASAAPSALYDSQQHAWGFSSVLLGVAFASYALALLVTLLVAGKLSDFVGRRPVAVTALALEVGACLLMAAGTSIGWVIAARAAQGIAMGGLVGALGASIVDLAPGPPRSGPIINSFSAQIGSAVGALLTGWALSLLARPGPLVFAGFALVFAAGAVIVTRMPDLPRRAGALRSLRPGIAVPARTRSTFVAAAPVMAAGWMLAGLVLSLAPGLIRVRFGLADAGFLLMAAFCILAAIAGVAGAVASARRTTVGGAGLMALAALTAVTSLSVGAAPAFFIAALVGAVGFGLSNAGALRAVLDGSDPDHRAQLLSAVYVVGYLAFGLPVIAAGLAMDLVGATPTAIGYTLVVAILSGVGVAAHRRPTLSNRDYSSKRSVDLMPRDHFY